MHRPSGAEPVLQTKDLGKRYGDRWAVRGLNLQVHRGDVFGFLGPNGAGKSTTIRMVLSLIAPTSGEVELFGRSLNLHRTESLRSVGGIVEKPDFYLYLSAVRNLEIVGSLIGGVARQRILEVLDLVGLGDRGRDLVKTYSHGMKQRLGIAQALLGDPELVILDEPTNGLDPQGMKEIRELIVHLARDRRKTVFLSSHLLNEVEMVANRMAILAKGELVAQGEVEELLKSGGQYVFVTGEPGTRIRSVLRGLPLSVTKFEEKEGGFEIWMDQGDIPSLNAQLVRRGVRVASIVPRRSLEEYFLSITEPQER
ncbi:MAG TPA: ABC transporter ATP-binding protein [Bacteroidota bacterium]|nr:ABC transporter ATP-binding protein [Bacteroidota bacterium]